MRKREGRNAVWPVVCALIVFACALPAARPQNSAANAGAQSPGVKADAKKAREAFQTGKMAEGGQDWEIAYESYSQAVAYAPANKEYALRREVAKGALVQSRIDAAERDAVSGRLDDARRELFSASFLDPTNSAIHERIAELLTAQSAKASSAQRLGSGPHLEYRQGTQSFDYRGDSRGAYDQIAQKFGVEDAFDADLRARSVHLVLNDVDFPTAMRLLGNMTGTFWRPLTSRLFFVSEDTPQKRRDLGESAVRTILLPASESNDEMTEILRVLRDITGITRTTLDTSARSITLRASPQAIAVATDLIDNLEEPSGQMVLEIELLEVDRNYARQLGIVPPEHIQAAPITPQEIQEASQSATGLVSIINQIFGLPSSLSGLSPTQIAGLLSSGNLSASALLPAVIAFGGGDSIFLATLPGATANFSEALSLVKHGERVLLLAQDGKAANFFDGEHFPVSLASYSSSLSNGTIPGVSSTNFPTTTYDVGNVPQFITSAVLRPSLAINDLIVANESDGTVGVLLGNGVTQGDGTFATQVTYPTDPLTTASNPVWIATGDFDSNGSLDLAVANKGSNTIGILLASAAADGTFEPAQTIATGASPVSVVTGLFHDTTNNSHLDLAVANQSDNTITIFQGNGNGTFITPAGTTLQLPTGFSPAALATADLNGDGHADLVVADEGNDTVSVFLGNGDGTFQPRADYATGNSPVYVAISDLNADGVLDLVTANNGAPTSTNSGDSVTILLGQKNTAGTAAGTFAPGTTRDFPAGTAPTSVAIGDFNVDGFPDLVVSDGNTAATGLAGDNSVSLLLGAGDGTFSSNVELAVGTNPQSMVSADFNSDSKPDLAVANAGSNNVTVILDSSSLLGGGSLNSSAGTPFPNVQYIDIGFKVKATPRIHLGGDVTLDMEFDITSLSTQNFNSIPVVNSETLHQVVRLKQDETSALATFRSPENTNNLEGTPGIAGLPALGWLAQNQNAANQNSELLILITPRMVRYAPRKDRVVYAGQGALPGEGSGPGGQLPGATILAPPPAGAAAPVGSEGQPPPPAGAPPSGQAPANPAQGEQPQPNPQPPPQPLPANQ